jgi:hypothetical protein
MLLSNTQNKRDTKYALSGALIARHLAARGPIYGGIIAARIVAALELPIAPHDILLTLQRLDLAAMKLHHFVTANSCAGKLVYRMLFTDGEEREVPLRQPSLFSIDNRPWSRTKEELDVVTQHATACCIIQVVDITLMKYQLTNITSLRVVQQKHSGLYSSIEYYKP